MNKETSRTSNSEQGYNEPFYQLTRISTVNKFLARDSILHIGLCLARYVLSPVRPSVCHTGVS